VFISLPGKPLATNIMKSFLYISIVYKKATSLNPYLNQKIKKNNENILLIYVLSKKLFAHSFVNHSSKLCSKKSSRPPTGGG
jgi:hypothetical protein